MKKPSKRHGRFILAGKSYSWVLDSSNRLQLRSSFDEWDWFMKWQKTAADLYYSANGIRHDEPRLPGQWSIRRVDPHPFAGMSYDEILNSLIRVAQAPSPWAKIPTVMTLQSQLYAESMRGDDWGGRLLAGHAEDRSTWKGFIAALAASPGMTVTGRLPRDWKPPMHYLPRDR